MSCHELIIFLNEIPLDSDFVVTPTHVIHNKTKVRFIRTFPEAPAFYMFSDASGVVDWIAVKYYKRVFASGLSRSRGDAPLRIKRPRKPLSVLNRALLSASGYEAPKVSDEIDIPEVPTLFAQVEEEESENIAVSSSSESEESADEETPKTRKKKKK